MTATLVAKNVAGGFAHRTLFEGLETYDGALPLVTHDRRQVRWGG